MERGIGSRVFSIPRVLTEVREPRTERLRIVITQRMRRRLTLALALVAGLVITLTVAACGSSSRGETTPPPNYAKALKGAPAPLAKLYGEANVLLPGGKDAFEKRVGELGYPVVANVWASWCGCREFLGELEAFHRSHPGVAVVSIACDAQGVDLPMKYLAAAKATHSVWIDANCHLVRRWKLKQVGVLILVDENDVVLHATEEHPGAKVFGEIETLLSKPAAAPPVESVRFGPFVFHLARGELRKGEEVIRLTDREREILRILCATPGETVSRLALAGNGEQVSERAVDVQVNRLRRKIERDPANPLFIQTVRGIGYRLVAST